MPAISKLMAAAKRQDCVLGVFPYMGGSVLSNLNTPVFPSMTMRNFASEPQVYRDYMTIGAEKIGTGDFGMDIDYERVTTASSQVIFYPSGAAGIIGIFASAYGSALTLVFNAFTVQSNTVAIAAIETQLRNKVRFVRTGNVAEIYFNDVLVRRTIPSGAGVTRAFYYDQPVQSTFNGYVHELCLKIGTPCIYSYPTWDEKYRLITTTNARLDRGIIEAANTGLAWAIKTQLVNQTIGTIFQIRNGVANTAGTGWTNTTGTLAGSSTDNVSALLIFNRTLNAGEIAALS